MEKPMGVRAGGFSFLVQRWVFPFKRTLGTWAFVFNRWSGILLAIYLYVHLGVISTLAFKPEAYDQFLVIARTPLGLTFDVILILLLLYHGLNGLRIIFATLAGKIEQHRWQFWGVVVISLLVTLVSAIVIFSMEA
jgi:succinate dehydrogenase / fumarate reductase cytochrome b subunit